MKVSIPDNFLEERRYTLHVLLDALLGMEYTVEVNAGGAKTILEIGSARLEMPDHFFRADVEPEGLYTKKNLPLHAMDGTGALEGLKILYGEDHAFSEGGNLFIGADLVGSAYFMLSRWEEQFLPKDKHGRAAGKQSFAHREGFLARPVVNEYASFIRRWLEKNGVKVTPGHRFRKVFTCDVDIPFYWSERPFRKLAGSLVGKHPGHPAFREKWKSWKAFRGDRKLDPYFTFHGMAADALEAGADMRFHFLAGGKTEYDPPFYLDDPEIQTLIRQLAKEGHGVGLHGSYASANDGTLLSGEKQKLEEVAGQAVLDIRQHYLRCDACSSPAIWQEAGFERDATFGYADAPGFRHGICHPFPLFDLASRKRTNVMEWPLAWMDATLLHYLDATPKEASEIAEDLIQETRKHDGAFVFLWHNSSFEYGGYGSYFPVYNSLLSH